MNKCKYQFLIKFKVVETSYICDTGLYNSYLLSRIINDTLFKFINDTIFR